MKRKGLIDLTLVHSASYGNRAYVIFNRHHRGQQRYRPTVASVRRLNAWFENHLFECSFWLGPYVVKVNIELKRE